MFVLLFVLNCALSYAVFISNPCCSEYAHVHALFGPQLPLFSPGVFGHLSRSVEKDCSGAALGSIVMIDRGLESFVDAVKACQEKGAIGVIVRNVFTPGGNEDELIEMGSLEKDPQVVVPSVFISKKSGDEIDVLLANMNSPVDVQLFGADDLSFLYMYYLSYFFTVTLFFAFLVIVTYKCMFRFRKQQEEQPQALLQFYVPLNGENNNAQNNVADDIESKPVEKITDNKVFTVLYSNGRVNEQRQVPIPIGSNDEPIFEQQEQ